MTMKEIAKKIIASINPGNADISGIGDGTIKGALVELNSNFITTYDELVLTHITEGADINIPNYQNYKALYIRLIGDNYNGITMYIPSVLYETYHPFSLYSANTSNNVVSDGYSIRTHGNFQGGIIHIHYVHVVGWSGLDVCVLGLK